MKTSVSTSRTDFKYFADCGFEALDFQLSGYFGRNGILGKDIRNVTDEQIKETFTELKRQADEAGIEIYQTHSVFDGWFYAFDGDEEEAILNIIAEIKANHYLGSKYIVVHPPFIKGRIYDIKKKENFELAVEFYAKLQGALEEYDVYCCTENMFNYDPHYCHNCATICSRVSEMIDICNAVGRRMKICVDVGHAVITQDDPVEMILEAAKAGRLGCLHLHDNDGMNDLHTYPFMSQSAPRVGGFKPKRVDWTAVMTALKQAKFDGAINFEVGTMGPACLEKDCYEYLVSLEKYLITLAE